jgi:hypothetical protein
VPSGTVAKRPGNSGSTPTKAGPKARPAAYSGAAATAAAAPAPRVRVSVRRLRGKRVRVQMRVADGSTAAVRALLEVRLGGRAWRAVAMPRLSPGRTFVKTLRLPRGTSRVSARSSLVDVLPSVVARLR